ncbi:putative p68 RNA helicase [Paratrimastix pyriformis]|uniref:P68 RNA helicase n=1 Tax=Paratrimastix pyriformis TaxID=342808 RepID=A0ABQ8UFI5_9EUKA|nr:putative p68 RNA helicase [Paratrimastix pyriformis]
MNDRHRQQGFPAELFVQAIPDVMVCPICQCVMRQAVTLMCRGSHKACEACCEMWVKKQGKATCPCCRQELSGPHFNRDPYFNSLIQQLSVRCAQRPCEWQGKLEDLDRHQTQECSQREVGCSHAGCPHRCPASALPAHLDGCGWKPEPCTGCCQVMPRKDLPAHRATVCPAMEGLCPDCHQPCQRSALDAHRAQCPEAPLPCPVPGCDAQVARCRMEHHIATAAPQHVICLGRLLVKGQADLEATKAALSETQRMLSQSTTAQQRMQTDLEVTKAALSETQKTLSRSNATQQRLQTDLEATKAALDRSTTAQQRLQTDLEATKADLCETQGSLSESNAAQQQLQADLKATKAALDETREALLQQGLQCDADARSEGGGSMPPPLDEMIQMVQRAAALADQRPPRVPVDRVQLNIGSPEVSQLFEFCSDSEKRDHLMNFLDYDVLMAPRDRMVVFANTKRTVDELTLHLRESGYSALGIHGDKCQAERDCVMTEFREGTATICITTDAAARIGIDSVLMHAICSFPSNPWRCPVGPFSSYAQYIRYVVNYDMPACYEARRVARAVAGISWTPLTPEDGKMSRELIRILTETGQPVPPELTRIAETSERGRGTESGGGTGIPRPLPADPRSPAAMVCPHFLHSLLRLLANLRRSYLMLKTNRQRRYRLVDSDCFAFDLQAQVPILLVGLGLRPGNGPAPTVSRRSVTCLAHSEEAWVPMAECPSWWRIPRGGQLVPMFFEEPMLLAAGESVAFRCTNAFCSCGEAVSRNEQIYLPAGVMLDCLGVPSGRCGFVGEIFYTL